MIAQQFEGQRICIVGATAGIGLAIARRLADEGAHVVIGGRDLDRARRAASGIGRSVEGRVIDVLEQKRVIDFSKISGRSIIW